MPRLPDWRRSLGNDQGFTFIEVLIASAIFAMVLVGVYVIYDTNQATYTRGEGRADLQQNIRVALDEMTREILMAGYDPTNVLANPGAYSGLALGDFAMQSLAPSTVRFVADVNGDGDSDVVEFSYDPTNKRITRRVWALSGTTFSTAGAQAITEDNTVNFLTFTYYDDTNSQIPSADYGTKQYAVRRIEVSFSGTVKVGSQGTQSLALNSDIRPRNLSLE